MPELSSSLVQRLRSPLPSVGSGALSKLVEAFSFGAGGGRLSDMALDILRPVFSFDYMGASEYEFGALPDSLSHIAGNVRLYGSYEYTVLAKDIKPNWERHRLVDHLRDAEVKKAKLKNKPPPRLNTKKLIELTKLPVVSDKVLYFFGNLDQKDAQSALVKKIIDGSEFVKAGAQMDRALDPITEYDHKLKGWLDEKNHCFWFIDKEMRDATAKLFTGP